MLVFQDMIIQDKVLKSIKFIMNLQAHPENKINLVSSLQPKFSELVTNLFNL